MSYAININHPHQKEIIKTLLDKGANPNIPICAGLGCREMSSFIGGIITQEQRSQQYFPKKGLGRTDSLKELINHGGDVEAGWYSIWQHHYTPLYSSLGVDAGMFKVLLDAGANLCRGMETRGVVTKSVFSKLM